MIYYKGKIKYNFWCNPKEFGIMGAGYSEFF